MTLYCLTYIFIFLLSIISSPVYSEAKRLAQLILAKLNGNDWGIKDMSDFVRKNSSGYDLPTLINLVSTQIQEGGIKVWR